jgi:peptide/nickel transport system permease protein
MQGETRVELAQAFSGRLTEELSWRQLVWRRFVQNKFAVVSAIILIAFYLMAIFAPLIAPQNPNAVDITTINSPPSSAHWFGTDESGRDILSRLVFGARASMTVGLVAMAISIIIGTVVGGVGGYAGRWIDSILMRFTDGMMAIPYFFLILVVIAVFGASFFNIIVTIGVTSWMTVARLVRSEVLRFRSQDFVLAARALGASKSRILVRHIMPHTIPTIIVAATLGVASAILLESALSFLGLGIQPPTADWGNMLSDSQAYIFQNPLLPLYPGALILIVVLAYNFVGDGLRDAL